MTRIIPNTQYTDVRYKPIIETLNKGLLQDIHGNNILGIGIKTVLYRKTFYNTNRGDITSSYNNKNTITTNYN